MGGICSTDTIEPENRKKSILCVKCQLYHVGDYKSPDNCYGCRRCNK